MSVTAMRTLYSIVFIYTMSRYDDWFFPLFVCVHFLRLFLFLTLVYFKSGFGLLSRQVNRQGI
jgi:hypothetical protein